MKIVSLINSYSEKVTELIPDFIVPLVGRLAIFSVFWRSVQTKIGSFPIFGHDFEVFGQNLAFWNLTSSTFMLFEYEYELPMPTIAAYAGTFGEFFLSLLILFGVFTRYSALGLLVMTTVIQFVYPDGWPQHILWFGILLYLLKTGGGKISLDRVMR